MNNTNSNLRDSKPVEWFADGLRFECTTCGNCCSGPPGYVWFTEEEGRAMASAVGMELNAFRQTYARKVRGRWSLIEIEREEMDDIYDCVFLDRETQPGKALCRVYKARPHQCRTWPFWPEMVRSEAAWTRVKQATPCPGMGNGKLYPAEKIRILRDSTPDE